MYRQYLKIVKRALYGKFWRLNLGVTNRCNSRCLTCNVWKDLIQDELSVKEYRLLFKKLGSKLRWLHLTGGEPFLRSDLGNIIACAVEACPNLAVVDLSTNGFLSEKINQMMEKVVKRYPKIFFEVGVSLDGRPSIHEHIRNVKGCWSKIQNTWRLLKSLPFKYSNFKVHANFTISPWNTGELPKLCSEFSYISPLSLSIYHLGHSFKNTLRYSPNSKYYEKVKADISWFLKHGKATNPVKKLFLKLALKYVEDPSKQVLPCEAASASYFIDPEGNVYPCTLLEYPIGNIRQDPQLRFLSSKSTEELKKKIKSGLCSCWSGCECWSSILKHMPLALMKAYSMRTPQNNRIEKEVLK